jgi:hypothetical protein
MFVGFVNDSITVPSCEAHNGAKTNRDNAIIKAMLMSLRETAPLKAKRSVEVVLAIQRATPRFHQVKALVQLHKVLTDPTPELNIALAYLDGSVDIATWMRQLTAALVADANGDWFDPSITWASVGAWSAEWDPTERTSRPSAQVTHAYLARTQRERDFEMWTWIPGWPSGPRNYPANIYNFKLHFNPTHIHFRHRFFDAYNWYVWFTASPETQTNLRRRVGLTRTQ